ncbi:GNAT family N-acetyltransferase [Acetivibrio cellulolyticus]|uniref:GNAT family N-acetyltransferase n=1 Tax=Acetivibrio cellulolyticus TaxID=35830 RepID=UPI0001E2D15E|nr:GNAT family N-acetyltransferase [Acetivibrio cellulolyticus]
MIKKFDVNDLDKCAKIMMLVYNNEYWQCQWSLETAKAYLMDYVEGKKFIGYTLWIDNVIKGAIFCHEKIWWNNNEIFIDEMFVSPEIQRQGYGTELLNIIENHIKEHNLAGFTLSTNRFTPAPNFYRKNGFSDAEHVLFMYKEI